MPSSPVPSSCRMQPLCGTAESALCECPCLGYEPRSIRWTHTRCQPIPPYHNARLVWLQAELAQREQSSGQADQPSRKQVYTVDLRNHGDSPHADTHDSHGMTADLVAFTQAKSIPKACLMGHSMGGRAAMHFALNNPQLSERLIVVDISPVSIPGTIGEMGSIFSAMKNVSLPADLSLSKGRQAAKEALLQTVGSDSVDFILLNLRKRPQTGEFYWACNVDILHNSLPGFSNYGAHIANLPAFTGPTTFICGTHSPYMNPDDWPEVLKFFPNASLHWLDTGHLVHLEEPHKFIEIVTQFLNEP
ncbi:sn-1-specific diacylglycerol lipase ABHD11 isoform X2 [Drosophila montana]|uniref:sn-1-specific diacylglycerol lipase ABHD11 isoform X2 n=1 Tax=Drosophila montana TaxID=40370 RepID=UPI00313B3BFF